MNRFKVGAIASSALKITRHPTITGLAGSYGLPVTLTWDDPHSGLKVKIYRAYTHDGHTTFEYLDITDGTTPSYVDSTAQPDTLYYYAVTQVTDLGDPNESIKSDSVTVNDFRPVFYFAAEGGDSLITTHWYRIHGADQYYIYVNDALFAIANDSDYSDGTADYILSGEGLDETTTITNGNHYDIYIRAYRLSDSTLTTPTAVITRTPMAHVNNLGASNIVTDGFRITWDDSVGTNWHVVLTKDALPVQTDDVLSAVVTYSGLDSNSQYAFNVNSHSVNGDGPIVSGSQYTCPLSVSFTDIQPINSGGGAELSFAAPDVGYSYKIYSMSGDPGAPPSLVTSGLTGTSYDIPTLTAGNWFFALVINAPSGLDSSFGELATITIGGGGGGDAPSILSFNLNGSDQQAFDVSWTDTGANSYSIFFYYDAVGLSEASEVTGFTGTSNTFSGMTSNTDYYVKVVAYYSLGGSAESTITGPVTTGLNSDPQPAVQVLSVVNGVLGNPTASWADGAGLWTVGDWTGGAEITPAPSGWTADTNLQAASDNGTITFTSADTGAGHIPLTWDVSAITTSAPDPDNPDNQIQVLWDGTVTQVSFFEGSD